MSVELQQTARPLDPNVLQRRASDPASSVWVSASAGTGKTKVLTDRVLRLLLPQENGTPGCAPHKILGLTFTKAAASEMALRINETLSEWAIAEENVLHKKLENLLGRAPDKIAIEAARKLFADVIDTPGRLKIMTIHAFCQSVLSRFPLEAKLTPGFQVAEERAAHDYLSQAKIQTFSSAAKDKTNPLFAALQNLSQVINEDQLSQLIGAIASERGQLDDILQKHFGIDGLYTALCQEMNVTPNQSPQSILATACEDTSFNRAVIKSAADAMAESTKTDAGNAKKIHDFLASNLETRIRNFETYKSAFLKQDGEIRAKLLGKKISDASPHLLDTMQEEALRLQTITDKIRSATAAALTRDLLLIGKDTLDHYEKIKTQHNMLDYEDLIFKTRNLMQNSGQWVHYKLDQGIDHILIDEAQDTNPEQWSIIEALCAEFFAAHSEQDTNRTIFTVGDEKQSIYSFQRASPEEFERMRSHFGLKITTAKANWEKVDLNISFRSTKSVLAGVDQIFADPQIRRGLGIGEINHEAFRRGQAGLVELWPLFENDKDDENASITWDPPITIQDQKSGSTKCAENIADQIAAWIENKEIIESYNRPIEPRDILVLVRTRNAFVAQLMRALKSRNVPVGGLDRIVLNDQLAVQDMLAACDFALLPSDDLTLACLLKSPLIGIDEDTLFTLAHGRNDSLWSAVQDTADPKITSYLRALIHKSRNLSPYAFLAELLQSPCPADDTSGWRAFQKRLGLDAYESLNELLNAAITFEFDHTASLQNFVQWQRAGAGDIKRENDDQDNHVRIMTVHGSKGLQAPIVFLPDTTSTPGLNPSQAGNRLLWPTQTGQTLPLWAPRKDIEDSHFASAKDKVLDRLGEEYRRLLYVAMTRAEDRLYITGYKSKRDISEDCWYAICRQGLQTHNEIEELEEGRLRLSNPQIKDADRKPKPKTEERTASPIPKWMTKPAPTEPEPPAPLIPSRPAEVEPAAISPLQASDNYRFRRGNVTHKLLQFLPDLAPEKRRGSMETYLEAHANDLPQSVRTNIVEEIEKILNDPTFAPLFAENSRAEVPITGLLPDGRLISGQIDRLLITDNEIMIVDYKSNRPPPTDPKDIPQIYRNQLKAYADVLKSIYPERKLTCALLWTNGPNLMEIK